VKPAAATLLAASMFTSMDPVMASALGLVTGGAVAGGVHVVKAKARLASSVFTFGAGNPVLSLAEDVLAVIGVALAMLLPFLAAFVILSLLAVIGFFAVRHFTRTRIAPVGSVRVIA